MLNFLKWIFLVFGGLALSLLTFFYAQNSHDLKQIYNFWNILDYDHMSSNCIEVEQNYLYPCFREEFSKFSQKVSLTGVSVGMKLALNFIEKDKVAQKKYITEEEKKIVFGLAYLDLNNMAIENSYKRFFGFSFTYGGFVGKIKDFSQSAQAFSDGIISGLESPGGIQSVANKSKRDMYLNRLNELKEVYKQVTQDLDLWLKSEIQRLEKKYK